MSESFEKIPSHVEKRLRRMMSPAAYEKLRERVKGPEDLEKELNKMEQLAEVKFRMETEPKMKEALKSQVREDIAEHGVEEVLEQGMEGDFDLVIESNPDTNEDQLVAVPEGNVQEKIPIKPSFSDRYLAQFTADA